MKKVVIYCSSCEDVPKEVVAGAELIVDAVGKAGTGGKAGADGKTAVGKAGADGKTAVGKAGAENKAAAEMAADFPIDFVTAVNIVYGGVDAGLMHTVARAASEAGISITGIVPKDFAKRTDMLCDMVISTEDLSERKSFMIGIGDIFVVLPGGIGTIDEWISTLSSIMVQERTDPQADKPILVWNHKGMYDGIISQLAATSASVYARGKRLDRSEIFPTAEALAQRLKELLG